MKNILFSFLTLFLTITTINAQTLSVASSKITMVSSYSDFGSGDIIIQVETPAIGCDQGFWLGGNDAGVKNKSSLDL